MGCRPILRNCRAGRSPSEATTGAQINKDKKLRHSCHSLDVLNSFPLEPLHVLFPLSIWPCSHPTPLLVSQSHFMKSCPNFQLKGHLSLGWPPMGTTQGVILSACSFNSGQPKSHIHSSILAWRIPRTQKSLVEYSLQSRKESDITEQPPEHSLPITHRSHL